MYTHTVLNSDVPFQPQFQETIKMRFALRPSPVPETPDARVSLNYTAVAQSRDDLRDTMNSPSVSIWPFLVDSAQTQQMNSISVYAAPGKTREHSRTLYMNAAALLVWRQMGHDVRVIGESHRPPRTATLSFGFPFSE